MARSLRGAPTMLLGVIVRDIADPFFAVAVESLTAQAAERGYNVVLGTAHGRTDAAIALRAVLETRHCDAIVVMGDTGDQPRLVEDLRSSPIPVVGLWQGLAQDGTPTIGVDNRSGIELALEHLASLGHERIAFVGGRPLGDIQERRSAYTAWLTARGLPVRPGYVRDGSNDLPSGDAALRALMSLDEPPTALICSTDQLALGALHAAHALGLRIPDDVSVVGFDDLPMAAYSVPSLTTVAMPIGEIIARALGMAIDGLGRGDGFAPDPTSYAVRPVLVVRGSSGPAIKEGSRR